MTYSKNRLTIGYQKARVLNPWVFADLRQPQRMRGFVSPLVYQTRPPSIYHPNLSGLGNEERRVDEEKVMREAAFKLQREGHRLAKVMAMVGVVSLALSAASLAMVFHARSKALP